MDQNRQYAVRILGILCPLVYFASYLTRKDYSIIMDVVISSEGTEAGAAGLVETMGVISYGAGQIISGILGDRFKPQRLISCGMLVTICCNLAMPFAIPGAGAAIWLINGLAQSMLWPPMVRIMATFMDEKRYNTVAANVNVAGITGTVFLYLTSSLIWLKLFDSWKMVFFASAAASSVVLAAWIMMYKKIESHSVKESATRDKKARNEHGFVGVDDGKLSPESTAKRKMSVSLLAGSGFIFIALAIVAQGALRDGITDWVPTLLRNTFGLASENAILYAVAIPIIGVISMKLAGMAANKLVREELNGAGTVFAAAGILCALLYCVYSRNRFLTVAMAALIVGCMHAINFFLVCVVPAKFERYGLVATMSGVINSLTYVGTALAVSGFPKMILDGDWGNCILLWAVIAAVGTLLCFACVKKWKAFKQ